MTKVARVIHPLTSSVRAQLKSSIQITSLLDVIEQLLRNAIDANARHVHVAVDFKKGSCTVLDDGEGIPEKEFDFDSFLAQAYCTSRSDIADCYGRHGYALASIAASSLLRITSRQRGERAHTMILHHGKRLSCGLACVDAAEEVGMQGTKIALHNLFGNLPVRFKAQALKYNEPGEIEHQFNALKRRLAAYALACPSPVAVHLHVIGTVFSYRHKPMDAERSISFFSVERIQNILKHISPVPASDAASWKLSSAKAGDTAIRFAVCMKPSPSKHCQFISFGRWPLYNQGLGAVLYDVVNEAFDASDFGTAPEHVDCVSSRASSQSVPVCPPPGVRQRQVKAIDRWPCFYIEINCVASENLELNVRNEGRVVNNSGLQYTIELLSLLVHHFLERHVLRPKQKRRDRSDDSKTQIQDSQLRAERVRPFGAWPRCRSAYPATIDDVRQGLPFIGQEPPFTPLLNDEIQLLLNDMELDSDPFPAETQLRADSMDTRASTGNGTVTWTNPKTGRTIRLNDNSFVVPPSTWVDNDESPGSGCNSCLVPTLARRQLRQQSDPSLLVERLKQWPVGTFSFRTEAPIADVGNHTVFESIRINGLATVTEESLSISDLVNARILRQVDDKFILVTVQERPNEAGCLLVLIDQHAADERIKVEGLFRDLCAGVNIVLSRPLIIESNEEEVKLFAKAQMFFAHWGIVYQQNELCPKEIRITHLPRIIAERCRQEPKMLIDLLRREIWAEDQRIFSMPCKTQSWLDQIAHCPRGLIEMINSRACRSAIMFNDMLTIDQSKELLAQLAKCTLPFQCAHGRPSLTILARLGYVGDGDPQDTEDTSFGKAFEDWK